MDSENIIDQEKYIAECNIKLASNIGEFEVGEIVLDKNNNLAECMITDKTSNSIEVFIKRSMKHLDEHGKSMGVDAKNFFTIGDFNKRFIKK